MWEWRDASHTDISGSSPERLMTITISRQVAMELGSLAVKAPHLTVEIKNVENLTSTK